MQHAAHANSGKEGTGRREGGVVVYSGRGGGFHGFGFLEIPGMMDYTQNLKREMPRCLSVSRRRGDDGPIGHADLRAPSR